MLYTYDCQMYHTAHRETMSILSQNEHKLLVPDPTFPVYWRLHSVASRCASSASASDAPAHEPVFPPIHSSHSATAITPHRTVTLNGYGT